MQVEALSIIGAKLIVPKVFSDDRGYFKETYSATRYVDLGLTEVFAQDNISMSRRMTLRGLHGDRRMSKLVQVLQGRAFDVLVDIRPESKTFGKWEGFVLEGNAHKQIYIPAGCLHGFLALDDNTILSYKQSAEYDPSSEVGVAWDDATIGIAWPLDGAMPLLSAKDARNPTLAELGYRT